MENMTSFSSDIIHHFFKVYIPSHSSHNLNIPTAFIQKMNGVVPGVSSLKDPLGRIWQVEVEKVEGIYFFQTGWREFVEANCLNLGDFMVFRFMGNSVFKVTIFDNSGCEKNNNLEDIGEEKQEQEHEEVEGGEREEGEEDNIGEGNKAKQEHGEEDIGEEKEAKQEHKEGEGGNGEEDIGEEKEAKQEHKEGEGGNGEEDIVEEKEAKQEHKEGEGGNGEEDIGEEKEEEQEEGEGEGEGEEGDYEFAAFDEPKNPYFIASVRTTRPYDLHIPQAVVQAVTKDNDIEVKPSMEFLDHNQIKWPIRVCFRKDGRRIITKGWKDFWTRNNLTSNDKCIFEFKPDEEIGSTSTIIQVSILRATPRVKGL